MKISLIIGIIAVLILIGIGSFFLLDNKTENNKDANNLDENIPISTENKIIEIKNFAYSPSILTIKKGDTVTWTNMDSVKHTVTSDTGKELDSQLLTNGESYSHTFDTAGIFAYHCTPHPYMKARVIVE